MKQQVSTRARVRQQRRQKRRKGQKNRSVTHPLAPHPTKLAQARRVAKPPRSQNRQQNFFLIGLTKHLPRLIGAGVRATTQRRVMGQPIWLLSVSAAAISFFAGQGLGMLLASTQRSPDEPSDLIAKGGGSASLIVTRPQLSPLPKEQETWNCEVVVIGGTLGGVAAASHAMQSGAVTCLIEVTPWLGGQISSQGVSALDESQEMRSEDLFSESWSNFKRLISRQPIKLPDWVKVPQGATVADLNSCWVGMLCFIPEAGANASEQLLQASAQKAPGSRWGKSTAFKGADFTANGRDITAIYAVRRTPRDPNYMPKGKLSSELPTWYSWESDAEFEKTPIRLQAPSGKRLIVIDATDTGELIGWARIPYRLGSESLATTGERNASRWDNPDCTQAFTYPFVLAIRDDNGASLKTLETLESVYPKEEHRSDFDLQGFPMFTGRSVFNYRRIVSTTLNDPYRDTPSPGDMTAINWNRGNDWKFMDPPLVLNTDQLDQSGQRENWMGGLSTEALQHAEFHALLFAHWLLEKYSKEVPMSYLSGADSPMGTLSGLSMKPYFREGRRIVGARAYNQRDFAVREADLRRDLQGGRDFSPSAIAKVHYSIDIHGCRYRTSDNDGEASSASVLEDIVRPTLIPLEALIPQGVDNLLVGGKSIAVTHIANGMTRIHQGEWSIGASAGATAGWLVTQHQAKLNPADIVGQGLIPQLRQHLDSQGLSFRLPKTSASSNLLKNWVGRVRWNW